MTDNDKITEGEQMLARFMTRVQAKSPGLRPDECKFIASMLKDEFIRSVQEHIDLYGMERNGLSLWRALRVIADEGEVIPPALLKKFLGWGEALEKANDSNEIARALELIGDKGTYKGRKVLQAAHKRRHIAEQVHIVRSAYPALTLDEAFRIVVKNSQGRLTYPQVKKAHFDYFRAPKAKANTGVRKDLDAAMRSWNRP